jgi:hypothetical protein
MGFKYSPAQQQEERTNRCVIRAQCEWLYDEYNQATYRDDVDLYFYRSGAVGL